MFYYIEKDGEIMTFEESKENLKKALDFMPQYQNLEIVPFGTIYYLFQ